MQDEGYLVHFPESRTYGLSTLVTEVGTAAMRAERLELLARPLLTRLVKRTGLPVVGHVGVLQAPESSMSSKSPPLVPPPWSQTSVCIFLLI